MRLVKQGVYVILSKQNWSNGNRALRYNDTEIAYHINGIIADDITSASLQGRTVFTIIFRPNLKNAALGDDE